MERFAEGAAPNAAPSEAEEAAEEEEPVLECDNAFDSLGMATIKLSDCAEPQRAAGRGWLARLLGGFGCARAAPEVDEPEAAPEAFKWALQPKCDVAEFMPTETVEEEAVSRG